MATLIQINNISKSYGKRAILENASLTIGTKQKIGVIGRNGAGKTTLLKIIVGDEGQDGGNVIINKNARLGYLEQQDPYSLTETVMGFLTRYTGKEEWQCGKIANKFQLKNEILNTKIEGLSGGYQMRVKLTAMLLKEPNLLLLDEPTNYLDLSTLLSLENFLRSYNGGFLVISHDREFLKNTCDKTLEVEHGKLFLYPRPLEEYLEFKEEQVKLKQSQNESIERERKQLQQFVDRFRAKASKATQAQSKLKQIGRLKNIDIAHPLSSVKINIPRIEQKKGLAFNCEDMSIGYGQKVVAKDITLNIARGKHIAIVGDNGQGKTTLLKTMAKEINHLSGKFKWAVNVKTAYYAQHVPSMLNPEQEVLSYLEGSAGIEANKENILKMAGSFLFSGNDLKKKISVLSGGEKARLCLAGILLDKSQVLLLDEPENHLDFETVEALGIALKKCNQTVLFISHNRTFANLLATGIIEIKDGKATRYYHNYEEYVYHLGKTVDESTIEETGKTAPDKKQKNTWEQRKENQALLRSQQKKARNLEAATQKLYEEKEGILKKFEEEPTVYSKERRDRLNEIESLIEKQETEWLAIDEELAKMVDSTER